MVLEVISNDANGWEGDFAVNAETGPYAFQTGDFDGTITNGAANATCELEDGTTIQLTGTVNGDRSLSLTRSDIPGSVLKFTPLAATASPNSRANVTFNLTYGSVSGQVVLSTSPVTNLPGMTEYRGTYNSFMLTFYAYDNGYASMNFYPNDYTKINA